MVTGNIMSISLSNPMCDHSLKTPGPYQFDTYPRFGPWHAPGMYTCIERSIAQYVGRNMRKCQRFRIIYRSTIRPKQMVLCLGHPPPPPHPNSNSIKTRPIIDFFKLLKKKKKMNLGKTLFFLSK